MTSDDDRLVISRRLLAGIALASLTLGGVLWWWPLLLPAIGVLWSGALALPLLWRAAGSAVLAAFLIPFVKLLFAGQLFFFPSGCSSDAVISELRQLIPQLSGAIDVGPLLQFSAFRTISQNPTTCRVEVDFTNTGTISGLWGVQTATYTISATDQGEYHIEVTFE